MTIFKPVLIQKSVLVAYWRKYANSVLPWLKGRPVTLEQVFDNKVIYRRYTDKSHTSLITIDTEKQVNQWAYRHTYSFHPYICSKGQSSSCWYVLDIDPENISFKKVKYFTKLVVDYISDNYDMPFIAFCGNNGFHIFLELGIKEQQKVFAFSKRLSLDIAKYYYTKFFKRYGFYIKLTSKAEQTQLEIEFNLFNSVNKNQLKVINLDTRILHKFANIRSPYSIHPKTGLVSLPVNYDSLLTFNKNMAKIDKLI